MISRQKFNESKMPGRIPQDLGVLPPLAPFRLVRSQQVVRRKRFKLRWCWEQKVNDLKRPEMIDFP